LLALYRYFGYFGLASLFGCLLFGFRYDPAAPRQNLFFNLLLYAAFAIPHLVMTRSWFKRAVWGSRAGTPVERRAFITLTNVTWLAVYALHWPMDGVAFRLAPWLQFAGLLGALLCMMAFFEGATFAMLDGLLGVPGAMMTHTHDAVTPLLTAGAYARVRHPMYRAMTLACLCSLVMHANTAQLVWAALLSGTFILFISIEERQLIEARGEEYRAYCRQTPYRLFRGVW
jgi:protein-S-isoprenylcysteine O-methyltransferase Ste14